MTPTKLFIGRILAVFAIVTLGLWAATQWAASMLAYLSELRPPRFEFCFPSTGLGRLLAFGFIAPTPGPTR